MVKKLKSLLSHEIPVFYYDETDSTNLRAKEYLKENACDNALFVAKSQTNGRGRLGRSFYSQNGLYMTYVISPDIPIENTVSVTTMASVAVLRAIKKTSGKNPLIKWVNDICLDGKKICGILTEAVTENGNAKHILIGIGINLGKTEFPDDIKDTAGSLGDVSPETLCAEISNSLYEMDLGDISYLGFYKKHSLVLGKEITYFENGIPHPATAIDIDSTGGLVVKADGQTKTLRSGEITVRIK